MTEQPEDKRFIRKFAWFWSIFTASYLTLITFLTIPEANVRFADSALGFLLGTAVASAINYFFGSSMGSDKKTEMLGERNE